MYCPIKNILFRPINFLEMGLKIIGPHVRKSNYKKTIAYFGNNHFPKNISNKILLSTDIVNTSATSKYFKETGLFQQRIRVVFF